MSQIKGKSIAFEGVSLKKIAIGIAIGLAVMLAGALIFSLLLNGDKLSPEKMPLWAGIPVFAGGLTASVVSSGKRRMIVSALAAAVGLLCLLMLVGFGVFPGAFSAKSLLYVLIILLVSCILGSVVSSFIK